MSPETIRKIDYTLGRLACFFLTVIRSVVDFLRGPEASYLPPAKIMFIKLIEQGATVLASSAIYRACEIVGRNNVYFLVFEENKEILSILDLIPEENVISLRKENFIVFFVDLICALRRMWRLKIDAVIDMEFFARASAVIAYLSGARIRVGLHRFTSEAPYRGDLMTHRVQYNPYLHAAQFYRLLVEVLTADPKDVPLLKKEADFAWQRVVRFSPSEKEKLKVWELLCNTAGYTPRGRIVLLNPNASDLLPLRKWPEENFVALGRKLLAHNENLTLVITGAPSEAQAAEAMAQCLGHRRVVSLAGKTSLRELLVLYTLADVLVTNDSGPGHFASLTDIFNIILFGPETPRLFGPIAGRGRVIEAGLACSPCVNVYNHRFSPCRNNVCMKSITVEEVFTTIVAVLKEGEGR
ncbi:MAG TPA: glycosyltransferase family 9 protein [Syntrophales bacterium]|nr:glycosyltransferase family 9 protein [Syntrophales bacterium]HOL60011.1 glycosyltransferase family 9 protein [Syntrophales bacterium]HPO36150.1 glycosyltransferase family 9 protein [Syntrophales bacterium]